MEGRRFQHQPLVSSTANLHALRPTRHRCTWAKSLAWSTSNGCDDQDQTRVGRCQKALERPLRMKGETTETAVYALRTADIRLQPTGPQIDFERSVIWRFEKPCSKSITRWARLSMGGPPMSPMVRSGAFFSFNL